MYSRARIWLSRHFGMYRPLVATTREPRSSSAPAVRAARIILISGLAPVIPCIAIIIWQVGFVPRPHHVALACIIAVIFAVFALSSQLLLYRLRMKRATRPPAETGDVQG
jgi:hypothetical protein